jgi:O-6-methylguanine DNA methyltransferase
MEIVHTAEIDSPIGRLRIASTRLGLAHVELPRSSGRGFAGWRRRFAPDERCVEAFAPNREAARKLLEYLEGKRRVFGLPLDLRGTPFQCAVYREMARIPYGETCTYGELALALGRKGAQRAVGAASGANPLPLVVPCHRVVAADGRLGGYGGGLGLKARLLALESACGQPGRLL